MWLGMQDRCCESHDHMNYKAYCAVSLHSIGVVVKIVVMVVNVIVSNCVSLTFIAELRP